MSTRSSQGGAAALMQIVAATHAGTTTEEFEQIVRDWIASAVHPATMRRYDQMIYRPMLDVLAYLDEAPTRGWVIVDMKRDWRIIYP